MKCMHYIIDYMIELGEYNARKPKKFKRREFKKLNQNLEEEKRQKNVKENLSQRD